MKNKLNLILLPINFASTGYFLIFKPEPITTIIGYFSLGFAILFILLGFLVSVFEA